MTKQSNPIEPKAKDTQPSLSELKADKHRLRYCIGTKGIKTGLNKAK